MEEHDTGAALLSAILESPEDDRARLVYADWLLERGDPRGELIQLQCAVARLDEDDPSRRRLEERAADLLAMHESSWTREMRQLGSLGDHAATLVFRGGFVEKVRLAAAEVPTVLPKLRELTPVRQLVLSARYGIELENLATLPSIVEIEGLTIQMRAGDDGSMARAFAGWPHRGRLRHLDLGGGSHAAETVAALGSLAGLSSLHLAGVGADGVNAIGAARHLSSLRELDLAATNLDERTMATLARAEHLTGLVALEVPYGGLEPAAAKILAASPVARGLERLRLQFGRRLGFEGARAIGTSEDLARLKLLDLEQTNLGPDGLGAILGSERLGALARLDVSSNRIGGPGLARALAVARLPGLRHLACASNELGVSAGEVLASSAALDRLQSLDLSDNPLESRGLRGLTATKRLADLRTLRLRNTKCNAGAMGDLGASDLGARLWDLDLGSNDVGDRGVIALLSPGRLVSLQRLGLRHAGLGALGLRALAGANLPELRVLELGGLVGSAVRPLLSATFPGLRELVMDGIDDEAAHALARAEGFPRLRSIVAGAREMTDGGAEALAASPHLQNLAWLELDAPLLGERGGAALRARFGHRVAVFAGGSLHAFGALSRRV